MFRTLLCGLLVIFSLLATPLVTLAKQQITTVEGFIERVTNDSIVVRSQRYFIDNVPLEDLEGKSVGHDALVVGKKVWIFFEGRGIKSIQVYEPVNE